MKFFALIFLSFTICGFSEDFCEKKQKGLFAQFEKFAEAALKEWNVPGMAIAIVKDGGLVYAKGFGVRDLCTKEEVTPHTLFQIGSISKSFTATLMAMMVDEKLLRWDKPVTQELSDFMLYDSWVTRNFFIEDLLSQKTGLPEKIGDMQAVLGFCPSDIIFNLRFIPPQSSFRFTYAYQNIFYLIASEVLKKVSGYSWASLLHDRIFLPLDMKDTSVSYKSYLSSRNRSSFYLWKEGRIFPIPDQFPYIPCVYLYGPAGGINSNVVDLAEWIKFQFKGKNLVSEKNLKKLQRPQIYIKEVAKKDTFYGLGWMVSEYFPYPIIWHNGETCGAKSTLGFIPEEKLGIVILTNARGSKLPEALMFQFFDLCFRQSDQNWSHFFLEEQKKNREKKSVSIAPFAPMPLQEYVGVYQNKIYGNAIIFIKNQELMIELGPKKIKMKLIPWDRDIFSMKWPVDFEDTKICFHLGTDGSVEKMVINFLFEENEVQFDKTKDYFSGCSQN